MQNRNIRAETAPNAANFLLCSVPDGELICTAGHAVPVIPLSSLLMPLMMIWKSVWQIFPVTAYKTFGQKFPCILKYRHRHKNPRIHIQQMENFPTDCKNCIFATGIWKTA